MFPLEQVQEFATQHDISFEEAAWLWGHSRKWEEKMRANLLLQEAYGRYREAMTMDGEEAWWAKQ